MKVLITGAGGMLARDVRRVAEWGRHEVVALDRAALDVTDAEAVERVVTAERPDVVVNCAAWTDVDGAESDEAGALALNRDGARNVAAAAAAVGAAVVLPSTDYVFDGRAPLARTRGAATGGNRSRHDERAGDGAVTGGGGEPTGGEPRPYVESDPTGPLSAYGRTKLAGERAALEANPRCFVVRTSWLFGIGGGNFVETMLRLGTERDELRVVDDQVGSPTYTGHLADGLLRLAATESYGIHHMAGDGHCSWFELAREIFARADVDCAVTPVTTAEFPRPAPRPAWSVLDSERPNAIRLPDWRDGLRAYLAERDAR